MSDRWQTQIAQLNLDLMEIRVAKAEAIKRFREVSAELHHTRTQNRDQLESYNEQIHSLQDQLNASGTELTSAKSKIEELKFEIVDYQTALRHRSETEQNLREFLLSKENELMLKDESAEQYSIALQREISSLSEDNKALRASLSSEQRAGTKTRQDLEIAQSQVISLHSQIAKMKAEIGILRANWQSERSRVLQLDNGQVASIMRDREQLKIRLEDLESKLSSAESVQELVNERDNKVASLSKEMGVLKAAIEAKDNIILKLDSQLATLQHELHEKSAHMQRQNNLIEDLYRRLKDSEIDTEQRPQENRESSVNSSNAESQLDRVGLYEIWRELHATLITVNSVPVIAPGLPSSARTHDFDPSLLGACDLTAVQSIASDLRQRVTEIVAADVGQSCAMQ